MRLASELQQLRRTNHAQSYAAQRDRSCHCVFAHLKLLLNLGLPQQPRNEHARFAHRVHRKLRL
jgi:hypothetical protein